MISVEARTTPDLSEAQRIQTQGPIIDGVISDFVGRIADRPDMENGIGLANKVNRRRFRDGTMTDIGAPSLILRIPNGRIVVSHGIETSTNPGGIQVKNRLFFSRIERTGAHRGPISSDYISVVCEYEVTDENRKYTQAAVAVHTSDSAKTPDTESPLSKQIEKLFTEFEK